MYRLHAAKAARYNHYYVHPLAASLRACYAAVVRITHYGALALGFSALGSMPPVA